VPTHHGLADARPSQHDEREERRADRAEHAQEEGRPHRHLLPGHGAAGAERGGRRAAALPDPERNHALLVVAVVGDDAPAHRVVPVPQTALQRDHERP
jgi:hypothetical protein